MGHSDKGDASVPLPAASPNPQDGAKHAVERGVKTPNDGSADAARDQKINDLKQAVSDGTYQVSPEEVARKIIEHMLEPKG